MATEVLYRTSSVYELVLWDRLAPEERAGLGDLGDEPGLYGVLRPRRGEKGTWKAVDRETALLLLTLREPGPPPAYARREGGPALDRELAALVLDGVLEIDAGSGEFVSGAAAVALLGSAGSGAGVPAGALGALSLAALRYAAALEIDDPVRLSRRLYDYHRIPLSRPWLERFPDADAVRERLELGDGRLPPGWFCRPPKGDDGGWLAFARRGGPAAPVASSVEATYKLYLSPPPSELRSAAGELFAVLPSCPVAQLKIGADAAGLLRPDKIVLYFGRFEDLGATSARLAERLDGMSAHGVPFTAEIAGAGLLSWGVDPPPGLPLAAWQGRESWRIWLADRLALALLAGRQADEGAPPAWEHALQRLELEGVDVERWMPRTDLWKADEA